VLPPLRATTHAVDGEHLFVMRLLGNGRYALVRELGRGGMGVVWLANDTTLGRDVAVKELMVPGGIPAHERDIYQERVLREARIASRLTDAGLVTIHDLIRENGETYIVMELIKAPTLTEFVEEHGPMPLPRVAKLGDQLLSALEVAHEAEVVHRDVKPGNVMVPVRGSAKLTDFGIAQSFEDPRLTSVGTLIGSPAYMSPERLSGGEASPAWDLWALGATLFYAAEGYAAFERPTTSATMLAVLTERAELKACRGALAELITGLLEPDPELRIRGPRARDLIEQALGHTPADEPTIRQTLPKPKPPQRTKTIRPAPKRVPQPVVKRRRGGRFVFLAILVTFIPLVAVVVSNPEMLAQLKNKLGSPSTSRAMQPVLTYGPGGDIADLGSGTISGECLNWVPVKQAAPPDRTVGCFGPHDAEVLEDDWANRDVEKDVPYPGLDSLTRDVGSTCTGIFLSSKVAGANKEDTLRYWVVVPNADAWKLTTTDGYRMSHRKYYCYVGKADGTKLTDRLMTTS
jgi:eukaryotic-like serine/threonine-protein kinase